MVFFSTISEEAKELMEEIKVIDDWLDTAQLICTRTDGKAKYDFNKFMSPSNFALKIYRHDLTLQEAEDYQKELKILINRLNNDFNPKNQTKIKEQNGTLKSEKKISQSGVFPYIDGFQRKKDTDEKSDEESMLENEEIDATDMPDLETGESAAKRRNQPEKRTVNTNTKPNV